MLKLNWKQKNSMKRARFIVHVTKTDLFGGKTRIWQRLLQDSLSLNNISSFKESAVSHVLYVYCNLLFLLWYAIADCTALLIGLNSYRCLTGISDSLGWAVIDQTKYKIVKWCKYFQHGKSHGSKLWLIKWQHKSKGPTDYFGAQWSWDVFSS